MDAEAFKKAGIEVIDYIADYKESITERVPIPDEEPGFMRKFIPLEPPEEEDTWENLMQDLEEFVMPGLAHWMHPNFNAYFPTGTADASFLGILLGGGLSSTLDKWAHGPAATELDMITLDWYASAIGLPDKFMFYKENSKGGGTFQASASECSFMCIIAAQQVSLEKLKRENPTKDEQTLLSLQTAYCSKDAHSSIPKNCLIALTNLRLLESDELYSLRGETLEEAIEMDIKNGFKPFLCIGTFGTTSAASMDNIDELGSVCEKHGLWLHVDGAYAFNALVCPEFRQMAAGLEKVTSLNVNASKWFLVHFDVSIMYVDDRFEFVKALNVSDSPIPEYSGTPILDSELWGTREKHRSRSFKLWFVLRSYGIEGVQKFIRSHVELAKYFAELVQSDDRFEVVSINFGLVCFRLKASNEENAEYLAAITATRKIFMVPTTLKDVYSIRYTVTNEYMTKEQIKAAWDIMVSVADNLSFGSQQNLKKDTYQEQTSRPTFYY